MGSIFSSSSSGASKEELASAADKAKEVASSAPVVVFSKTYCGYCHRVKHLLTQLGVSYKVVELDKEGDGAVVQSALADWTGLRTVPNVFIGEIISVDVIPSPRNTRQVNWYLFLGVPEL